MTCLCTFECQITFKLEDLLNLLPEFSPFPESFLSKPVEVANPKLILNQFDFSIWNPWAKWWKSVGMKILVPDWQLYESRKHWQLWKPILTKSHPHGIQSKKKSLHSKNVFSYTLKYFQMKISPETMKFPVFMI